MIGFASGFSLDLNVETNRNFDRSFWLAKTVLTFGTTDQWSLGLFAVCLLLMYKTYVANLNCELMTR